MKRKIIRIDEEKCNGCGLCIPNCPEGALQIIDGKARLVSDLFCDGLGACLGHCPEGAIRVEEREAEGYDERRVMENIVKAGPNTIKAHLEHLQAHAQEEYLKEALDFLQEKGISLPGIADRRPDSGPAGCPGPRLAEPLEIAAVKESRPSPTVSRLRNWPVQLNLIPPEAPFLEDSELLIAADCVPVAFADFHQDLLRGKVVALGCPKFDDREAYRERLKAYFEQHNLKGVTVAHMEVPCCRGLKVLVEEALKSSGKEIPLREVVIGIRGEKKAG